MTAQVAYGLSDTVILQPFARESGAAKVGGVAQEWAASEVKNAWKAVPEVLVLEKNEATGSVMTAEAKREEAVSVLTGSPFLKQMLPQLYQLHAAHAPHVLHVATHEAYNASLADIALVRETGIPIINAVSAQEAHDCAIIAHLCEYWLWSESIW